MKRWLDYMRWHETGQKRWTVGIKGWGRGARCYVPRTLCSVPSCAGVALPRVAVGVLLPLLLVGFVCSLERVMNPTRIAEFMGIAGGQTSPHCMAQMPLKAAF